MTNDKLQTGQSLFEVILSLAVTTLIIIAIVNLAANSIRNTTYSKNKNLAARYSQEATEWLRSQRDGNIDTFLTNTNIPIWCLVDLSWTRQGACSSTDFIPQTAFLREAAFSKTTVSGKTIIEADIKITWTDSQGDHEVLSATNFTDWREK